MKKVTIFLLAAFLAREANARECNLPNQWGDLCHILENRLNQKSLKMKLTEREVLEFEKFLTTTKFDFLKLYELQKILPKTTIELLMSMVLRDVDFTQAEYIACYLQEVVQSCRFENIKAFDNNTSHIIGRKWHEIDYSGEAMTWQGQKEKYTPYGITDFRTLENMKKFFAVEGNLPYFNKIYKPIKKCNFVEY